MLSKPKVAVAMSGGVDSSIACLLLAQQGFEVIGLTMELLDNSFPLDGYVAKPGCNFEMIEDAKKICSELGIPHYTVNLVNQFEEEVITPFVESYRSGRTPNPCLVCNTRFKFGHLLHKARELGAEYLATGHYVQAGRVFGEPSRLIENHVLAAGNVEQPGYCIENQLQSGAEDSARFLLAKGKDLTKDQSYALYGLSQDVLKHAMFPLGNLTKCSVREIAKQEGLETAEKSESQEICFVTQGSYREFLRERNVKARPGNVVDTGGRVLGRHRGLAAYTIGQRRGLGISSSQPLYVVDICVDANEIIVGKRQEAYADGCYVGNLNFIMVDYPDSPVRGTCMVRYRGREVPATLIPNPGSDTFGLPEDKFNERSTNEGLTNEGTTIGRHVDTVLVKFDQPQFAVTPGQALVFYKGEFVYGGGTIVKRTW